MIPNKPFSLRPYQKAIGKDLDTVVAEGGGGKFKVTEVAGEDLSGHRHEIVDHVDYDGRSGEVEE